MGDCFFLGTGRDGLLADEDVEGLFALLPEEGLLCVFVPAPEGRSEVEEGRLCAVDELPEEGRPEAGLLASADAVCLDAEPVSGLLA